MNNGDLSLIPLEMKVEMLKNLPIWDIVEKRRLKKFKDAADIALKTKSQEYPILKHGAKYANCDRPYQLEESKYITLGHNLYVQYDRHYTRLVKDKECKLFLHDKIGTCVRWTGEGTLFVSKERYFLVLPNGEIRPFIWKGTKLLTAWMDKMVFKLLPFNKAYVFDVETGSKLFEIPDLYYVNFVKEDILRKDTAVEFVAVNSANIQRFDLRTGIKPVSVVHPYSGVHPSLYSIAEKNGLIFVNRNKFLTDIYDVRTQNKVGETEEAISDFGNTYDLSTVTTDNFYTETPFNWCANTIYQKHFI